MTDPAAVLKDKRVKLACGHRVATKIVAGSDTAWCPICKHDLFTGWPEYMEAQAQLAQRMKDAVNAYFNDCIETGVQPRLAAVVGACESHVW